MNENKIIDNGGSAFPFGDYTNGGEQGMTLRDYFAAAALTGQLSTDQGYCAEARKIACWSYEIADAMLEARKEMA